MSPFKEIPFKMEEPSRVTKTNQEFYPFTRDISFLAELHCATCGKSFAEYYNRYHYYNHPRVSLTVN